MIVCNVMWLDCRRYVYAFNTGKHKKKKKKRNIENHAKHIRLFDMEIHFRYDKCICELNTWLEANKYFDIYTPLPISTHIDIEHMNPFHFLF